MFIGVHRSGIALDTPQSWHPKEPEVTFRDSAESFLHLKKNDPLCLNVTIFSPVNHNGKQGHLIEFIHAYQQSTAPPKARGASFIYCCLQRQGKGTSFVKLLSTLRLPCNVTHTHSRDTHTYTLIHTRTHTGTETHRHTQKHTDTDTQVDTHTDTHIHNTYIDTESQTHTQNHTYTNTNTQYMHKYKDTQTHTQNHTYTRT